MSFKRDGDDRSLLNVLRKRRVQELFAENIPDEEAQMLSSGKFTCTVCQYKPVFDTIHVLTIHRSGKKHLENVKRAKEKTEELELLIELRQEEHCLQNGSAALSGISKTPAPLLTNAPYDARAQKNKLKSHDRKPTINLSDPSTNTESYLGGAKIPFCFLKNSSAEKPQPLKPYTKRTGRKDGHTSLLSADERNNDCHQRNVFKLDCLSSKAKVEESRVEQMKKKAEWDDFSASLAKKKCSKLKSVSDSSGDGKSSLTLAPEDSMPKATDAQKKELSYKYWQVAGSGWKKDWAGKWEKDEQAEFDSDEEPPDLA